MPAVEGPNQVGPAHECHCEAAAQSAALGYMLDGVRATITAIVLPEGSTGCAGQALVLPDLNRVECVLDDESDFSQATVTVDDLRSAGWDVWTLVPVARLGEAHEAFAKSVDFVQGWWPRPDRPVAFTAPEVA